MSAVELTLVHEVEPDGAADVELGLQVWAQLLVRRLRGEGTGAAGHRSECKGSPG